MNDSMVPCEAAAKQPNAGMIWSPGKTSIRNRPPLISWTTFASCWAAPWFTSRAGVQAVDIRPLDLGLRDDVGSIDDGGRGGGHHHPARRRNEPASLAHHAA